MFLGACAFLGGLVGAAFMAGGLRPAWAQPTNQTQTQLLRDDSNKLGERFETVARKVGPAVVAIEAIKPPPPDRKKAVEESGSGVLIRLNGQRGTYVLTNNHVIRDAPLTKITVSLADSRIYKPVRIWTDPESDIALMHLDAEDLPTATLGDSDGVRVGHFVLAFGSPFGLNQTVTHGIISARERGQISLGATIRIKDFLQTDAAINPGSSGGPLVNLDGEVIGLNTAIASHSGNNSGVSFSIPINMVKRIVRELLSKGAVSRGYLGMHLATAFEASDAERLGLDRANGAWVDKVYPDTPAAQAGLRPNDVVLQVDDVTIRNENHFINLVSDMAPGRRVKLQVWRDRKAITLDAVVGDWAQGQGQLRP
jgi:S1-C subfamily serine protease